MYRHHRFAARWQLVDDADVEVAIECHGKGARYRCRRHHEDMRRALTLSPELGTLCHAEAVLLVDDGKAELPKHHRILYHGMRAHEDVYAAVGKARQDLLALLTFDDTRQQLHPDIHTLKEVANGLQVLLGENLRGSHDTSLEAVVYGDEHGHKRHKGLATAHVPLEQAVHLTARPHVVTNLVHHSLLSSRQLEMQIVMVKGVEDRAYLGEDIALVFITLLSGIAQDVELHIEEFLKLQTFLRPLHIAQRQGIVNLTQRLLTTYQMQTRKLGWQQGLGNGTRRNLGDQRLGHLLQGTGVQSPVLHLLRRDIVRLHAHGAELHIGSLLNVGIDKLIPAVVGCRLTEDDILYARLVLVVDPTAGIEPYDIHDITAIGEMGYDALLPAFAKLLKTLYPPTDLHQRHIACQLTDGVDLRPVHIFIRIILQQVTPRSDVELTCQYILALWSHAREIHDVLREYIRHRLPLLYQHLRNLQVERRRKLDVLPIAFHRFHLHSEALHHGGIIGERLPLGLVESLLGERDVEDLWGLHGTKELAVYGERTVVTVVDMAQGVGDGHHGHSCILLACHLKASVDDIHRDERAHAVVESHNAVGIVGDEGKSIAGALETGGATVGKDMGNGEMILLAELVPVFLLILRQHDDYLHVSIVGMEALDGAHENGATANRQELLGYIGAHARAMASGNNDSVVHNYFSIK